MERMSLMSDSFVIRTPDHRVRVFVSSTLQELAQERATANQAISHLRLTPVLFELGARPHPPRDVYRSYLEQSHIFIGIYWQRYGWIAPDMKISGIEDEYDLSKGKPRLVYVKSPATEPAPGREPRLQALIDRIQVEGAVSYKHFSTLQELHDLVENDLALLLTERFESSQLPASTVAGATSTSSRPMPTGTVTFLFTDIESSTRRWEAHRDTMKSAVERHDAIMRYAIEGNEGVVFRTMGDAFCAAFTTAQQALSAALDAQRALGSEPWAPAVAPIKVRMALHTGLGEIRDTDYVGSHLNRIARLLSTGYGGQVLLSQATYNLVSDTLPAEVSLLDLGEHQLKDLTRPEHVFQVIVPDLPSEFPRLKTVDNRPNNLPRQATPLIGREMEIEDVCAMVRRSDVTLVTLAGPGGTGKTRLGLQVAADLLEEFADGVWFVELAALTDAGLVLSNIAQALGVKEAAGKSLVDTLRAYLAEKELLLVLDNFEQVLGASEAVAALIKSAPGVKVLVTSRVKLNFYGEHEYGVPPLSLPDIKQLPPLEQLSRYDAVRLFIERAQAARADFEMNRDNAPAIAEICVRLDGLPLAIELAAARVKMLTPVALLARLSSRLKLLTGGARDLSSRQQTLRGAIDWSYDLLSDEERQLFRRLAVFQGGWTLDAVEQVCNHDVQGLLDVIDGVQSLLDKSLVQQREGANREPRFWMLETIHEYAREKLGESGEGAALRREHALYFMRLAEHAQPLLRGAEQQHWLDRLDEELDNIRAALHWVRESKAEAGGQSKDVGEQHDNREAGPEGHLEPWEAVEIGLRIIGTIWRLWLLRGSLSEGREQVDGVLETLGMMEKTEANNQRTDRLKTFKANALNGSGVLAEEQGDYAAARSLLEEGMALRRELGDKRGIANSFSSIGMLAQGEGDYASARSLFEESLDLSRELGDKWPIAYALINLGMVAEGEGDYALARSRYEESLTLFRELGEQWSVANSLSNLGLLAQAEGDYASARSLLEESLALRRKLRDKRGIANSLSNLGLVAQGEGDYASARSLFEESLAFRKEIAHTTGITISLAGLGGVAVAEAGLGDGEVEAKAERGAKLLGAVETLLESMRGVLDREDRLSYERSVQRARVLLGDEGFERAKREGRKMGMGQAIEYAFEHHVGSQGSRPYQT
jgi:predicted ATPase/class 3 adenylate cyclase